MVIGPRHPAVSSTLTCKKESRSLQAAPNRTSTEPHNGNERAPANHLTVAALLLRPTENSTEPATSSPRRSRIRQTRGVRGAAMAADLLDMNPKIHKFHQTRFPVKYSLHITGFPPYGVRLQQIVGVLTMRY